MGCCLSLCRKHDSEPTYHIGYQPYSKASPAASAALPLENDKESVYPNPLFVQNLAKDHSRRQQRPGNGRGPTIRQPQAAMYSDTEDPVMIASTYQGSLKYVRGARYQSHPPKGRAQSNPRRPMAPMTESLKQRESGDLAAYRKVKADGSALTGGMHAPIYACQRIFSSF